MQRCPQGHYYDPTRYSRCPACGIPDLDVQPTRGRAATEGDAAPADDIAKTRGRDQPARPGAGEGRTVGLIRKRTGLDPVVGWLVCIAGPDKGRDYRIHSERNFLGRDPSMDLCIGGDDTISRNKHAILSFNPETQHFKILPGEGRGITYCNGEEVDSPRELQSHDVLRLGQTQLLFVPLCDDRFHWD
ncbi:MAG: hypothetical protein H6R48_443 [Proteobacteria bacterium]|nr:hypothetical protein [Pseudomonadota bacterium]